MIIKQGNIILVSFPFTDLSSEKTRPAVVISKKQKNDDFIVLAVTSQKQRNAIKIENKDLNSGELPIISFVRCDKVATLHHSLIRKVVASLNKKTFEDIIKTFKAQF